jgi:hypothetical protein
MMPLSSYGRLMEGRASVGKIGHVLGCGRGAAAASDIAGRVSYYPPSPSPFNTV